MQNRFRIAQLLAIELHTSLFDEATRIAARPDIWGELPENPRGHLEEAADSFTALLDMFYEVDPDYVEKDGEVPLTLPEDEPLVRSEAEQFTAALCRWAS